MKMTDDWHQKTSRVEKRKAFLPADPDFIFQKKTLAKSMLQRYGEIK